MDIRGGKRGRSRQPVKAEQKGILSCYLVRQSLFAATKAASTHIPRIIFTRVKPTDLISKEDKMKQRVQSRSPRPRLQSDDSIHNVSLARTRVPASGCKASLGFSGACYHSGLLRMGFQYPIILEGVCWSACGLAALWKTVVVSRQRWPLIATALANGCRYLGDPRER